MTNKQTRSGKSQLNFLDEIIVDNFAGGGGASTGMELATGRPVAIAINHDPDAILMHRTNHPYTEHLQASVWDVDPREVCRGRPVGLAWFSPDCKHFSKAKGAALVTAQTAKNLERLASMCGYREIGMVVDKLTREKMISLHTDALMPGERKGKQI